MPDPGGAMGEALAASADRPAAFRRFAGQISADEAEDLRPALEQARLSGGQRRPRPRPWSGWRC